MRVEKSNTTSCLSSAAKHRQVVDKWKPRGSQPRAKQSGGPATTAESKEMTAWKRRKEYDPRKSVAQAVARRGKPQSNQHAPASPDTSQHDAGQHDAGLGTADEIAKLSNAVAYNLSVLSQSSQSDAVTLVSHKCRFPTCCVAVFGTLCFAYIYLWLSGVSWCIIINII